MGVYLPCHGVHRGKAQYLIACEGAMEIPEPVAFHLVPNGYALVCVIECSRYDAACYVYNLEEFLLVRLDDGRTKRWLLMREKRVHEITGYRVQAVDDDEEHR
jgi:hypothetical protein